MWKVNLLLAKALSSALSMTVPVMVGFLGAHGLSPSQFATLKIWFSMAGFLFEIPLGIVSDRMGRKTALVLAGVLNATSAAMYLAGVYTFEWFLGAEICRAIGMAFLSGTDEALAFEKFEDKAEFNRFWPRAMTVGVLAEGVFWGVGIAGVVWGTVWQFKAALVLHILQTLVSAFLPETTMHELGSFRDGMNELSILTRRYFLDTGRVRQMMLYGALIPGVAKVANFLVEPVMKTGLSTLEYSVAGALLTVAVLGIAALGKKLARPAWLLRYGLATAFCWIVVGVMPVGIGGGITLAAILALLQLSLTAVSLGLNPEIDNTHRATILSYRGGLDRLVSAGAWWVIGATSIATGSLWVGGILLVLLVVTWRKG